MNRQDAKGAKIGGGNHKILAVLATWRFALLKDGAVRPLSVARSVFHSAL